MVLVVEDERLIRELLEVVLQEEGLQVTSAANGQEALECLRQGCPSVAVLDLMLGPGPDGAAVGQELRRCCGLVPVIVLSARRDVAEVAQHIQATTYLPKPFDLDTLLATIHQLFRRTDPPSGSDAP